MSKKSSTFAPAFEKTQKMGSPTQTNEVFVVGRAEADKETQVSITPKRLATQGDEEKMRVTNKKTTGKA